MKNILTIAFMLVCATISAQDTLCVMVTLDEVLYFDYQTTFDDGSHSHDTFETKSDYVYSGSDWGDITIEISEPRKRK